MQKTYVLDTNVLIQAPYALQSFEDNHLVLPLAVLEELDGLKNSEGEKALMRGRPYGTWNRCARRETCWKASPCRAAARCAWRSTAWM